MTACDFFANKVPQRDHKIKVNLTQLWGKNKKDIMQCNTAIETPEGAITTISYPSNTERLQMMIYMEWVKASVQNYTYPHYSVMMAWIQESKKERVSASYPQYKCIITFNLA